MKRRLASLLWRLAARLEPQASATRDFDLTPEEALKALTDAQRRKDAMRGQRGVEMSR